MNIIKYNLYKAITSRILEGEGKTSVKDRLAAFENHGLNEPLSILINKVAVHPAKITDEDIADVKNSGFSEDQIFELVICSAVGQADRQYKSALKALSEAQNKKGSEGDAA